MSLTHYSPACNRTYLRRFDHDEARCRHAAGESVAALAREYGVQYYAVWRVVVPGAAQRELARARAARTTSCESCGGPAMKLIGSKYDVDGRVLCLRCRADERRERLRFDPTGTLVAVRCASLDCANGERWQPPGNFTRGTRHREVRPGGIHGLCRACQTRARRRYRQKTATPCRGCGKPRTGDEQRRRVTGTDTGLCRSCWAKSLNGGAA